MQSLPAVVSRRYRILGKVGDGCTTEVFRALDVRLQRVVALKVLRECYREQESFTRRFEDEARAIARITHPNIVRVYDYDRAEGRPFMVMEYVHGRTLKDYLARYTRLPEGENRRLVGQLAEVLSVLGRVGITHPFLMPEEVLVTEAGTLTIVGIGIGKLGEAGRVDAVGMHLPDSQCYASQAMPGHDLHVVGCLMSWTLVGGARHHLEAPAPSVDTVERTSPKEAEVRPPGDRCVVNVLAGTYRAPEMVATGGAGASDPTIAIPVVNASSPEAHTVRFPAIRGTSGRLDVGRTVWRASGATSVLGKAAVRSYLALGQTWAAVARHA
ncbi:MAG: serine/threonine protein kinase [Chloroflexota bacterium]|nr:serine/threonine protein kinase [Chloroflexota bacterium]